MGQKLYLDGTVCIWLALGILLLPLQWLLAALLAAMVHEICHFLAAKCLGVRVYRISIGVHGCLMETAPMEHWKEWICAAAGPIGSLALLFLIRWFPRLAICGAVQGIFNLLPVYPMDGGRIFQCAAEMLLGKDRAFALGRNLAFATLCLLLIGSMALFLSGDWGLLPLAGAVLLGIRIGKAKNSLQTGATRGTIELPFSKR